MKVGHHNSVRHTHIIGIDVAMSLEISVRACARASYDFVSL